MIASIDVQLISLIERRLKVAERIGREKKRLELPIEDRTAEEKVYQRFQKLNQTIDAEGCGEEFASLLIRCAKHVQEQRQEIKPFADLR